MRSFILRTGRDRRYSKRWRSIYWDDKYSSNPNDFLGPIIDGEECSLYLSLDNHIELKVKRVL